MTRPDDFSSSTKELLAKRVGMKCSNPGCRQPTSGPCENPNKVLNVGVAGHITAASPGGPRYDTRLTSEERQAADNGIWLCQICGKLIDNDPDRYSVETLREWRRIAEQNARAAIEQRTIVDIPVRSVARTEDLFDRERQWLDENRRKAGTVLAEAYMEIAFGLEQNQIVLQKSQMRNSVERARLHCINPVGFPIPYLSWRDDKTPRLMKNSLEALIDDDWPVQFWAVNTAASFYVVESLVIEDRKDIEPSRLYPHTRIPRVVEALDFCRRFYVSLSVPPDQVISLQLRHAGLNGRVIANPENDAMGFPLINPSTCYEDMDTTVVSFKVSDLSTEVPFKNIVRALTVGLFELFDGFVLSDTEFERAFNWAASAIGTLVFPLNEN